MSFLMLALSLAPTFQNAPPADSIKITASAVSPKAATAAIGLSNGEIRVVDLATRKPLASIHATAKGSVARLTWSGDGARLAAAVFPKPAANHGPAEAGQQYVDSQGTWLVFDVATGKQVFERKSESPGHDDPGFAFSRDGKYLVTWGCEPPAYIWDIDAQHCRTQCFLKEVRMTCAAWSPDGETVYCGDDQGRITSWRSSDGSLRCESWMRYATTGAAKRIECVAVSHDGHLLAAGGGATTVGLWESAGLTSRWFSMVQDNRKLGLFDDDRVVDVAFDVTAETLVATTYSWGTASAWSVADGHRRWDYDFLGGNEVNLYVVFDPRGERIATWGLGMFSTAKVFAASSGSVRSNLESRQVLGGRGSAGWSSDGRYFIARTFAGLAIMDGSTFEVQGTVAP
jgi:WD40 repeat protein